MLQLEPASHTASQCMPSTHSRSQVASAPQMHSLRPLQTVLDSVSAPPDDVSTPLVLDEPAEDSVASAVPLSPSDDASPLVTVGEPDVLPPSVAPTSSSSDESRTQPATPRKKMGETMIEDCIPIGGGGEAIDVDATRPL
jgi:hypothetical protein